MTRFHVGVATWTVALAIGFATVFTLGRPLPTDSELLDAAHHPAPPVSQAAAEASAATIVRHQFPDLAGATPTTTRQTILGFDRWVVVYVSGGAAPSGVQISVAIASGQVEVASFP